MPTESTVTEQQRPHRLARLYGILVSVGAIALGSVELSGLVERLHNPVSGALVTATGAAALTWGLFRRDPQSARFTFYRSVCIAGGLFLHVVLLPGVPTRTF